MSRTVVLVGALDTKGEDFGYVKELIEGEGLSTLVVDFGVMGAPKLHPDIDRAAVAAAELAHRPAAGLRLRRRGFKFGSE